jgi:Tfp pilus tip-associated adhesin PilY1
MIGLRKFARRKAAVFVVLAALAVLAGRPALSDDTELLRKTSSNPFVFFLLDTSASMSLSPDGQWVHANGDDPRSKLYQVKRVLYEVLQEVSDVHFGFAAMNQDKAAARTKHWLYYTTESVPAGWPISYPTPDADGPVKLNADGTVSDDLQGDLMTFGKHIDAAQADGSHVAGSCASPLNLTTQREKINRYSKLGAAGTSDTKIWLSANSKTYLLTVNHPGNKPDGNPNPVLGQNNMNIKLTLQQASSCTGPTFTGSPVVANLSFTLWTDFLMEDEDRGTATAPDDSSSEGIDSIAGFWDFKDIADIANCDAPHPFSGQGWEGNYDGAVNGALPAGVSIQSDDPFCNSGAASCNIKFATTFDPLGRPMDRGDVIPIDWRTENHNEVLSRLAPNHPSGAPDFRIASYFEDQPDATTGVLPLIDKDQAPYFASGPTRLSKMITDFRCFYLGDKNKCNDAAYDPGWEAIDLANDRDSGCRKPYLIILSDGADTCKGEDPCADTANFRNAGIRTWAIAYGADCTKVGNPLKCMTQNTDGTLLCPQKANDLKTELLKILGEIKAQARAFASAAVPSVQAIVEDKIFLTNFTPFNGTAAWEGHVYAFKKPLPLKGDGTPDTSAANFLWDGAQVMLSSQTAADPLGSNADQRRVYYTQDDTRGMVFRSGATVTSARRLFDPTSAATPNAVRYDLWNALNIGFTPGNTSSENAAQTDANAIIATTLAVKTHTETISGTVVNFRYLLGDIFHSNPLVTGSPPNTLYFSSDTHGYRDFFRKHELRRKILLMGANDGMLHAFDAGMYDPAIAEANKNTTHTEFTNGSGKELFAYMPRATMPTVNTISTAVFHQWGVDGTVTAADVFVDPGSRDAPVAANREWRTVVFGGLREGGPGYFALDITQPDVTHFESTPRGNKEVPKPMNGYVPSCTRGDTGTSTPPVAFSDNCGALPFPAALWEFDDSVRDTATGELKRLDEDGNHVRDLGDTWSIPNVGRIRISEGGTTVEKFVMVVGGGVDPDNKTAPALGAGTWLYMVDVETGQAIYKRQLTGAAPSEPAAVDVDQDGFLDRIYIGTTAGLMYRVDLVADSSNNYPALTAKTVRDTDGDPHTVQRIPDDVWSPKAIFNASTNAGVPLVAPQTRPIYFRPSVIFVPKFGLYALAFGTGDREDLFANLNEPTGRFYVFVDDSASLTSGTIPDESRFTKITPTSLTTANQYLFGSTPGSRGWFMELGTSERLITDPFALSGVTFFSTFIPITTVTGDSKNPQCSRDGTSNVYIVSSVNANPYLTDVGGAPARSFKITGFVTNPFTESGQTKNVSSSGSGSGSGSGTAGATTEICDTPTQLKLKETLKTLFPVNCKFSNQTVDIKTISSDTRLFCIAPVPVCTIDKNWREH